MSALLKSTMQELGGLGVNTAHMGAFDFGQKFDLHADTKIIPIVSSDQKKDSAHQTSNDDNGMAKEKQMHSEQDIENKSEDKENQHSL